ncbi:MAG: PRC-barrel domain-containing protein [Ilumatobacter sp.]|uniref:PRC-barrel domain-containing protein n=1 Tax=Ilumatobacter sp. TaxID=1967498 RepID=UPI00329A43B9
MSEHTMKAMKGQAVIALDTAEEIGEVKHFVVSADGRRIERLHIDGRGKKALFTEWGDLESFGADRVMVKAADATAGSHDDRDLDVASGDIELIGSRVLDTAGFEHGRVVDAMFDSTSGAIVSIVTESDVTVDSGRIRSLGSYALVVDA